MASDRKKWVLTSPDGIGDFLFRVPWLRAMESAGWEMMLIAQAPVLEVARLTGLIFHGHEVSENPYGKNVKVARTPFRSEIKAIRSYSPELIVFGPSHPTYLEEVLSESSLPGDSWGFVVKEGAWFCESIKTAEAISKNFDHKIEVFAADPEPVRNAKAALSILGYEPKNEAPIFPTENFSQPTDSHGKVAVCVGYREGDYFPGWGEEHWIAGLRQLEATGLQFVFLGGNREAASHAKILQGLLKPSHHKDLTGTIPTVSGLIEMLHGTRGFVGKDGGMLHLSAALKKPVVAVFGGGHWGRFLPQGTRAVVLGVKTPCRGCDWRCHLPRPLCVAGLSPDLLLNAWERVMSIGKEETLILEEDLSPTHVEELIRESHKKYPAIAHDLKRLGSRTQRGIHRLPWPLPQWIQAVLGKD